MESFNSAAAAESPVSLMKLSVGLLDQLDPKEILVLAPREEWNRLCVAVFCTWNLIIDNHKSRLPLLSEPKDVEAVLLHLEERADVQAVDKFECLWLNSHHAQSIQKPFVFNRPLEDSLTIDQLLTGHLICLFKTANVVQCC